MITQRFSYRSIARLLFTAFILLLLAAPSPFAVTAQASSEPCAGLDWDPGPPGGNPVPTIGGTVTDSSGAGAVNASVTLIRCVGTETVVYATAATDIHGDYSFSGLPTTYAYVVSLDTVSSQPRYLGSTALVIDLELGGQ